MVGSGDGPGAGAGAGAGAGRRRDAHAVGRRLESLTDRARRLSAGIARAQAQLARLAGEIDELEAIDGMTTAQWLSWQCRLTPAEAHRAVRLGRRLRRLPALGAAYDEGRFSEGTANLLSRAATPANEEELLDTAEHATGAQLQTLVRDFGRARAAEVEAIDRAEAAAAAEAHPPAKPVEVDESVRIFTSDDGRFHLHATLRPERGGVIESALRAARDELRTGADPTPGVLSDPPRAGHSYADALVHVAEGYLGSRTDRHGVLPERYLTLVHVDASSGGAAVAGVGPVPDATRDELACESWLAGVTSRDGHPVTATSLTRCATPRQQRALLARDVCCQYPGCGRTRGLRAHHVVWASRGGPTRLDNLVLLCGRHHHVVHQPGFALRRDRRSGEVRVTTPNGSVLTRRPPPRAASPPGAAVDEDPEPPDPPHYDRLTRFGRDVTISHWLDATFHPDDPDPEPGPASGPDPPEADAA